MKRTVTALLLSVGVTVLTAGPAAAQPVSEPASCQGYLASWANPNYGFIVHELVMPQALALDTNVGGILSPLAQTHAGSIGACIPD